MKRLQEAELNIVRYEKCNTMLQTEMETSSDLVKEGMVCGYSTQGKDACQVSSWALGSLATLLSPHSFLVCRLRDLRDPLAPSFTLNSRQGVSKGKMPKARLAGLLRVGWERRGDSGRKLPKMQITCFVPLLCDRQCA